jgi:hypothetical protein
MLWEARQREEFTGVCQSGSPPVLHHMIHSGFEDWAHATL